MQTRYINTASTAGGNGTTNATSGANRAYASFSEWEAARQASLTEVEEVICEGSTADSSSHTIDGWTTTAANYILIRTTQANRHNGRWDTTKYRLTSSAVEGGWVFEDYVRFEGIQFQGTASGQWNKEGLCFAGNGDCRADACVAYACGDSSYGFRIYGGTARFTNCISYGNTSNGWRMQDPGSGCNVTFYNCLAAANSGNGFLFSSGTSTARNCYAGGNSSADWSAAPSTSSNNASEDGTHGTTIAYSTSSGAYFTNVTGGSENFEIGASSSFVDAGYDLSGTFTTDIIGNSRGATFDIGPFEYQASGGGGIAGSSALILSPVGTVGGSGQLLGTSALVLSPVAVLRGYIPASGTSTLTITPTAALRGIGALVGAGPLTFTPQAVLGGFGRLLGTNTLTFAQQGVLQGRSSLTGASTLIFSQQGVLGGGGRLSGASPLTLTVTGVLGSLGSGSLTGASTLTFAPQGILLGAGALVGAGQLDLGAAAILRGGGRLGGATSLDFIPSGLLSGILPGSIVGSSSIIFDSTASLLAGGILRGAVPLTFFVSGRTVVPSGYLIDGGTQIRIEANFGVIRMYSNGADKFYTF